MKDGLICLYCGGGKDKITFSFSTGDCYCERCNATFTDEEERYYQEMYAQEMLEEEQRQQWAAYEWELYARGEL